MMIRVKRKNVERKTNRHYRLYLSQTKPRKMKKFTSLLIGAMLSAVVVAQNESPYEFKTVVDHASTEVKDQCQTGTCWSYSTVSFIESELIRMGKGEHDLSEMFNVRMTYPEKAENYMRYQGKAQFSAGSLSHDVMNVIEEHGMVPNEVYTGLDNGETVHNHGEMDLVII